MRLRLLTIAAALVTAAACTSPAPEAPAAQTAQPVSVATDKVTTTEWPSLFEAGGIVHARVSTPVASRLMATVTAVHVRVGDRVRRGAPLVTLDAREMVANQQRAAAGVTAAQESALAAAADEAAADANLALARATHERIAGLASKKSATPQELDQAVAALAAAEAQVRGARARRAAADASRDAARAAGAAADTGASYTQLVAPFDALVTERAVEPGTMATPGTPLLFLEDPADQRLEVSVDESRAAWTRPGQTVDVSLDEEPGTNGRTWVPARIAEVDRVDPASHTFTVKIDLPSGHTARSGSVGRARVTGAARQALTLPDSALVRRGQLTFVFIVDSGNIARLRAVSTGSAQAGRTEVLAGVVANDAVVINPAPALVDGQPVRASAATSGGRP
ncbi:MAG: efflux RND transporter periplasmic adaptor subunit [Vicinamibacterales bacterium]